MVSKDLETSLKSFLSCKDIRDWEKPRSCSVNCRVKNMKNIQFIKCTVRK